MMKDLIEVVSRLLENYAPCELLYKLVWHGFEGAYLPVGPL